MKTKKLSFISLIILFLGISSPTNVFAQSMAGGLGGYQEFTMNICSDGSLMTFGDNFYGQLGDGTYVSSSVPLTVPGMLSVSKVVACSTSVCAVKTDGTVWTWGGNNFGELGDGTNTSSTVPLQITSLTGVTAVASGIRNFFALKSDGTVWSWGQNNYGVLGDGSIASSMNVPVQVFGLTGVISIVGSKEFDHAHALKSDGTVWSWGEGSSGQLGNGTIASSNVPVQAIGLAGITAIGGNGNFALALKNDGTVWAWGDNSSGQLGNGTNVNSSVPVQVTGLTGITSIDGSEVSSGSFLTAHAIKNDGTVWAWGENSAGELGNGTFTNSNVPVQVSGLTNIIAMSGGYLALKSDGTVWSWGYNFFGQLGNGTTTNTNIPAQIASLTGITSIVGVRYYSLAKAFDGTLYSFGWNLWGELGDGTTVDRTLPVSVSNQCAPPACIAYYTATYDSTLNNFTLSMDALTSAMAVSYSWDFGDGTAFSTLANPSHVYSVDSVYNVCMEIFTSTGDSCTYCHSIGIDAAGNIIRAGGFTLNVITGITAIGVLQSSNNERVLIYPNPSNGTFTVSGSEIDAIEVFNLLGEIVYSSNGSGKTTNEINIQGTAKGVYFMKTISGSKTETQKIIIQ